MTKGIKRRLQAQVLKRRGLVPLDYSGLQSTKPIPITPGRTLAMRLIEAQFGVPIEQLLRDGTLAEVGRVLGIDESTVSKWRLLLGLRSKADQSDD